MRTQPSTTCRIYLHPTAASNPDHIKAITARTGLAIIIGGNRSGAAMRATPTPEPTGPWTGGDAA